MTQEHSLFCWKKVTFTHSNAVALNASCMYSLFFLSDPDLSSDIPSQSSSENALPAIFWRAHYFQHKSSLEIISFLFSRLFLSFSLVSLHFAWCYSYLKKLEAMRNPGETSEARVQSETTSKGRFHKISFQLQSAKINLPLSDLVATTWA